MPSTPESNVVVAGASSGIGRAVALSAARAGRRVILFARRRSALHDLADEIRAAGGSVDIVVGDAGDPGDCARAVASTSGQGRLEALVNCVGMNIPGRALTDLTATAWSNVLAGNLDVAYHLTQAVLPTFRRQADGLLVHIASRSVHEPDASGASYQAAKAGVAALAHATAVEERANGVRVSVVYPGMTDTPLVLARPRPPTPDELARALQPADVASVVQMLLDLPARAYVPDVSVYPTQ